MNYLDGIAIGISQGLLVEAIVKDQIRSVFIAHYEEMMDSGIAEKAGLKKSNYMHLNKLIESWRRATTEFKDGMRPVT